MLEAIDISFNAGDKPLLHGVSAVFLPGKLYLILGPNGAGKSTFIKLLSGQAKPATGKILYNGEDLNLVSARTFARKRALLSQNVELHFPLLVEDIVMMGRYPHFNIAPAEADRRVCREVMQYFSIDKLGKRYFRTLSGGEQQRVHFARVMAQIWEQDTATPGVLLLDEPLTFLDVTYQQQFMQQLKALPETRHLIVIGVVHDLNLAAAYADQLLLMRDGTLFACGRPEEVLIPEKLNSVYTADFEIFDRNGRRFVTFK